MAEITPLSRIAIDGAERSSQLIRILLVEDCKSDVALMEDLLEEEQLDCFYEIVDVPRLVDAFQLIEREQFDLVMLDLNLTDIDGVSSVAALHAQQPGLPIVIYTGLDDKKVMEKAILCGAIDYLVKGKATGVKLKRIIESVAA